VINALTVDVEEHFQVSAFADAVGRSEWPTMPSRVERNTQDLLDLFDQHQYRATFFVLGWVAERHPQLVREIARRGHEVASHGYSHELIYKQGIETFREETLKSKSMLEDMVQTPVLGYRAASYSITEKSLWALDVLVEAGFKYDSSIFPVRHDRYGIPDANPRPHRLRTPGGGEIVEYPLTTFNIGGYRLPIAGGGYFRLFPYWFTRFAFGSINREQRNFCFYLHPWEVDPDQPRIDASLLSRFRHYNNLDVCRKRLQRLLTDFRFQPLSEQLVSLGLLTAAK